MSSDVLTPVKVLTIEFKTILTSPLVNGIPSSVDTHRCALGFLKALKADHPHIAFPQWFYRYEFQAAKISRGTVRKHHNDFVKECLYRITHPEQYTLVTGVKLDQIVTPLPQPKPSSGKPSWAKPTVSIDISSIVNTPIHSEIKQPTPTKVLDILSLPDYKPIEPVEEPKLIWPITPFDQIAKFPELIKAEPEKIAPTEPEKDPSPIQISMEDPSQRSIIEPPLDIHYEDVNHYYGPLTYPWIFTGFTLGHFLCEARAGYPFLTSCSKMTLKHLLLDLDAVSIMVNDLAHRSNGHPTIPDVSYIDVMTEFSLADLNDNLEDEDMIFKDMTRSDLLKVMIDFDEIITTLRHLISYHARGDSLTNEDIRSSVERIRYRGSKLI